jgi:putative FmdB family regulatory protein
MLPRRSERMPIYEYQCSKCGEVFEAFQKVNDKPLSQCKFCRGPVEKLISHSSFQLKGSGWYLTDYSRKSQSSGPSDSGAKQSEKSEKKAESTSTNTATKTDKSE